jgi:hypothetical protein
MYAPYCFININYPTLFFLQLPLGTSSLRTQLNSPLIHSVQVSSMVEQSVKRKHILEGDK